MQHEGVLGPLGVVALRAPHGHRVRETAYGRACVTLPGATLVVRVRGGCVLVASAVRCVPVTHPGPHVRAGDAAGNLLAVAQHDAIACITADEPLLNVFQGAGTAC